MPDRPMSAQRLGAYLLPGRADDPRLAVSQAVAGEDAGLGSVWLSERLGSKDLATIGGALSQATRRVRIGAAAGRPPHSFHVVGMVVVAADLPADEVDVRVRARLVTYLNAPLLGESLVRANGWDRSVLDRLAAHPLIASLDGRTADGNLNH